LKRLEERIKFHKKRISDIADADGRVEGRTDESGQGAQEEKYVHTDVEVQVTTVEKKCNAEL